MLNLLPPRILCEVGSGALSLTSSFPDLCTDSPSLAFRPQLKQDLQQGPENPAYSNPGRAYLLTLFPFTSLTVLIQNALLCLVCCLFFPTLHHTYMPENMDLNSITNSTGSGANLPGFKSQLHPL